MNEMTFKALFEHSSLGIIISNTEGVIEQTNPYASKIFEYEHGELVGKKIEVLIPSHLRERHIGYREGYVKNPQPRAMGSNLNLLAVKKDGTPIPVEISLTHFESNGHRQIVSFVNDITERKRAENELRQLTGELESKVAERTKELSDALLELGHTNEGLHLEMERRKKVEEQILSMLEKEKELNELKSRFVSMASHEFRTPLGGILTSVSLIAKYPTTEEAPKRERHIQIIKKSVKNLTNILNEFLSLDKLDQGKVTSNPSTFDITQFLDELVEELHESSEQKFNLEVQHETRGINLHQDKDMIRNVVTNLLSNAMKYSREEGLICLRTQVLGGSFILEVQDHGVGIPLEDQKHLFERFFRAHNVTTIQGTGLGLNIVKRYLELMDGTIEFNSVENQGTTFKISLPLEKK